ncbi:hypothetical protein TSOC_005642 [Tetrabaena socialis]|uniref:PUB domain-containing protein n=1 Tax=Tetrabaena socialis TaxID=47790 RepID=A0A2J8A5U0_9CHLO|nr:hypothetical protein TSOC_005642 [Tetrabaena socialis]|eukprot:PNH07867.1 hypothetical protein TSOC_005642 [Tetrabaena socialis]
MQVQEGRRKFYNHLENTVLDYFHNNPVSIEACLSTCIKLFGNVVSNPAEEKYRKVKAVSATLRNTVLVVKGGEDLLLHAGWLPRVVDLEKYWVFDAAADSVRFGLLKESLHLCERALQTVHEKAEPLQQRRDAAVDLAVHRVALRQLGAQPRDVLLQQPLLHVPAPARAGGHSDIAFSLSYSLALYSAASASRSATSASSRFCRSPTSACACAATAVGPEREAGPRPGPACSVPTRLRLHLQQRAAPPRRLQRQLQLPNGVMPRLIAVQALGPTRTIASSFSSSTFLWYSFFIMLRDMVIFCSNSASWRCRPPSRGAPEVDAGPAAARLAGLAARLFHCCSLR